MASSWNGVIWKAIADINPYCMDEIFVACEKKLLLLGAPDNEIELRLFALALYCQRSYPMEIFRTIAFARFGGALNFLCFEQISRKLIKENSLALIVFWAVLRCSFANSMQQTSYIALENDMRVKSLELGIMNR
jgi:hypothetical protein